jgi:hypothetical protein
VSSTYNFGLQLLLDGSLSWTQDSIVCALVGTQFYRPNFATDQYFSIVPTQAVIAVSGTLTGRTATDGIADASDITLPAVPAFEVNAVLIFASTGTAATSPLIAWVDDVQGLPVNPMGGNVEIVWDDDPQKKIFKL